MEIIDQMLVPRNRGTGVAATIQLLVGNLAAIPLEHAVDALVVSAFPNSYTPNRGTLFDALYQRGLDMREVALRKQEDERSHLGCWLSEPLPAEMARMFHFTRVICFEPQYPEFVRNSGIDEENIEETVGFVFRCLNNFIIPDREDARRFEISGVAMPLLATGNQRVPVDAMLPRLLDAAIFWLEEGLPVERLKIVVFRPADAGLAGNIFKEVKARYEPRFAHRGRQTVGAPIETDWEAQFLRTLSQQVIQNCKKHLRQSLMSVAIDDEKALLERLFEKMDRVMRQQVGTSSFGSEAGAEDGVEEYDVFISYAHKQDLEVKEFVKALQQAVPRSRVFFDRTSIPAGGQWIKTISDAVRKARTFVAVLSPDYTASPVCWDEFQCAKLKEYNTRQSVIKTVRLYSEKNMPPIIGIYSYIDCVEGDLQRLRESAATLLGAVTPHADP